MPIRLDKNPYPGINAHVNSWIQNKQGEWTSFHHDHITDLTRALNRVLPSGYEARSEHSLQIREIPPGEAEITARTRYPQPDSVVYQVAPVQSRPVESGQLAHAPTLTLAVLDTMDVDEDDPGAVVVYRISADSELGKPVTRIELLSPTNKPQGDGYEQYRIKRNATLQSGMPLIEIDYIHQQPSVIPRLPRYPTDPKAYPYSIAATDPRPSLDEGHTQVYLFDVESSIPQFDIPLDNGQKLTAFDLQSVYNTTLVNTPTFARVIDYQQLPVRFERYSDADRERIKQRMLSISHEHAKG